MLTSSSMDTHSTQNVFYLSPLSDSRQKKKKLQVFKYYWWKLQDLRLISAPGTGSSLHRWKVSTAAKTYRTNEVQGRQNCAPALEDRQSPWSNTLIKPHIRWHYMDSIFCSNSCTSDGRRRHTLPRRSQMTWNGHDVTVTWRQIGRHFIKIWRL